MDSELNNIDIDEAAKLFDENSTKEVLKSTTKSINSTRKNRSKSPTPSNTKNKRNKKSEAKKKKKKEKSEDKDKDKDKDNLELEKPADEDKNETEKNADEDTKEESIEKKDNDKSSKNENKENKKNKKMKKTETKAEDPKASETVSQNNKDKDKGKDKEKDKDKDKKKGKAKKKKTSDGAGESTDTTQITKNDNKSKARGKSKDKSKVKKKEENTKIDDPKQYVYDYMKTQNRPYSLINIFDNLHGAVKKSQLVKILDTLVDEGSLIMKEYNTKIYLFNQDKLDIKVSDADIDEIQKKIDEKREESKLLKDEITSKSNELKILTLSLTDDELKVRIKELKKELAKMKVKVDDIQNNKIDPVPLDKMNEAKENFQKELKVFKKTKKICTEIINDISDGLELKLSETYEKIGIENDNELMKQLNIDQSLINGK